MITAQVKTLNPLGIANFTFQVHSFFSVGQINRCIGMVESHIHCLSFRIIFPVELYDNGAEMLDNLTVQFQTEDTCFCYGHCGCAVSYTKPHPSCARLLPLSNLCPTVWFKPNRLPPTSYISQAGQLQQLRYQCPRFNRRLRESRQVVQGHLRLGDPGHHHRGGHHRPPGDRAWGPQGGAGGVHGEAEPPGRPMLHQVHLWCRRSTRRVPQDLPPEPQVGLPVLLHAVPTRRQRVYGRRCPGRGWVDPPRLLQRHVRGRGAGQEGAQEAAQDAQEEEPAHAPSGGVVGVALYLHLCSQVQPLAPPTIFTQLLPQGDNILVRDMCRDFLFFLLPSPASLVGSRVSVSDHKKIVEAVQEEEAVPDPTCSEGGEILPSAGQVHEGEGGDSRV